MHTVTLDQQYDVYASGRSSGRLQYSGTFRYRLLQAESNDHRVLRQTELQPVLSASWTGPYYTVRSNYLYREFWDDQNTANYIGRSAAVFAQTNFSRLPRLQGRYEWTRNVNDLDLLGQDTRMRLYAAGMRYSVRQFATSYDYRNSLTLSHDSGLERTAERHTGRFDNTFHFFRKAASLQTSYQIVDRTEREVRASNAETLLPVPAAAGLYLADPSPELGTLESQPALIDGSETIPVSPEIDLSGSDYHNFGLDFGAAVTVNYLFLSTDTLANPELRWAVYISDDNLSWNVVQNLSRATFSTALNRYEISFPPVTSRYFKLVVEPQVQINPVHPTELRALLSQSNSAKPRHSTDHRGNVEFRAQPMKWLHASVAADIVRAKSGLTMLAREQDGVRGNLRVTATSWAILTGTYQASRTRYPESSQETLEGQSLSAAVESQWLSTLSTRATLSRANEWVASVATRQSDAVNVRMQAQWFPGLAGLTEFAYIEDHRPATGEVFSTRIIGQSVDAQPVSPMTLQAGYRHYELDAKYSAVPRFRDTSNLRATWRLTRTVSLSGDLDLFREPDRFTRTGGLQSSWVPTNSWSFSAGVSQTTSDREDGSTMMNALVLFHWSARTEISFSYYHARYETAFQPNTSSARLGFNTRF